MALGTTFPTRATYGPLMRHPMPAGIPTAWATGCGHPTTATYGYPAIAGATCPTSAAIGTGTTASVGAGRRERAAPGLPADMAADMAGITAGAGGVLMFTILP